MYTIHELAAILHVNLETIRRWIRTGELKATMNSKKLGYLIKESDIDDFVMRHSKYEKLWCCATDFDKHASNIFTIETYKLIAGAAIAEYVSQHWNEIDELIKQKIKQKMKERQEL